MSGHRGAGGSTGRRSAAADDLARASTVVIDGNNLLHRVRGSGDEAGQRWLVPRLRAWRPASINILVILDGHAAPGTGSRSVSTAGLELRHAGEIAADDAIVRHLEGEPYHERNRTIVVTDDRELTDRARYAGAMVWRLDRFLSQVFGARADGAPLASIGAGRPDHAAPPAAGRPVGERQGRGPWSGRGATRKRGDPRRRQRAP
jgi:hypothetical protein